MLEKKLSRIVSLDEMQFGFMLDAVFILRRMIEKYHAKGKTLYMCLWAERKLSTEYQGKC